MRRDAELRPAEEGDVVLSQRPTRIGEILGAVWIVLTLIVPAQWKARRLARRTGEPYVVGFSRVDADGLSDCLVMSEREAGYEIGFSLLSRHAPKRRRR